MKKQRMLPGRGPCYLKHDLHLMELEVGAGVPELLRQLLLFGR